MAVDDSYTKSLLHLDGTDESTTFTDESEKSWSATGSAQIDTAQSKFGGASLVCQGTDDYISTADHADFNLSNGSFTLDFWIRWNGSVGTCVPVCIGDYASGGCTIMALVYVPTHKLITRYYASGNSTAIDIQTNDWTPSADTWYHVAIVRDGNNWYQFVDGSALSTAASNTATLPNSSVGMYIGVQRYNGTYINDFNGWIDELRLSVGVARWTSNFTPPSAAYGALAIPVFMRQYRQRWN